MRISLDEQKFTQLEFVIYDRKRALETIKANNLIGIFDSHFQKPISVLMGY